MLFGQWSDKGLVYIALPESIAVQISLCKGSKRAEQKMMLGKAGLYPVGITLLIKYWEDSPLSVTS